MGSAAIWSTGVSGLLEVWTSERLRRCMADVTVWVPQHWFLIDKKGGAV